MGKGRFAPHTRRFAGLPHEPGIYVAECSGAVIKIGTSSSLRGRLMSLASQIKHAHGMDLIRFHVVPRLTSKAAYEAETLLVRQIAAKATVLPGRREFFTGISFEAAARLASRVTGKRYRKQDPK